MISYFKMGVSCEAANEKRCNKIINTLYLFIIYYLLFIIYYLLFIIYYLLFIIYYLLFII